MTRPSEGGFHTPDVAKTTLWTNSPDPSNSNLSDAQVGSLFIPAGEDLTETRDITVTSYQSLGNSALIAAALGPSLLRPKHQPKPSNAVVTHRPLSGGKRRHSPESSSLGSGLDDEDNDDCIVPLRAFRGQDRRKRHKGGALINYTEDSGDDEVEDELDEDYENSEEEGLEQSQPQFPKGESRSGRRRQCHTQSRRKVSRRHRVLSPNATSNVIRKKARSTPLPKTLNEAGEADKMMFRMKNLGHDWETIRQKWKDMTGVKVGVSTLSVRYTNLRRNIAQNGGSDDLALIHYKKVVEAEQTDELWIRVAEKIKQENGREYAPNVLSKRYRALEKKGFQVSNQLSITNSWKAGGENYDGILSDQNDVHFQGQDLQIAGGDDESDAEISQDELENLMSNGSENVEPTHLEVKSESASPSKPHLLEVDQLNDIKSDDTLIPTLQDSSIVLVDYSSSDNEDAMDEHFHTRTAEEANLLPWP